MREYELMVVLNPTLTREASQASWERIKALIEERGSSINHEEQWGTRRLAYPIQKTSLTFTEGTYILGRFQLDATQTKDVEENLRLMEEVLRFLLVKTEGPLPVASEPPSPSATETEAETAESSDRS